MLKLLFTAFSLIFLVNCTKEDQSHSFQVLTKEGKPAPYSVIIQSHHPGDYIPTMPPKAVLTDKEGKYTFAQIPHRFAKDMRYCSLSHNAVYYQSLDTPNPFNNISLKDKLNTLNLDTLGNFNISHDENNKQLQKTKNIIVKKLLKDPSVSGDDKKRIPEVNNQWEYHPYPNKASIGKSERMYPYATYAPYRYDED